MLLKSRLGSSIKLHLTITFGLLLSLLVLILDAFFIFFLPNSSMQQNDNTSSIASTKLFSSLYFSFPYLMGISIFIIVLGCLITYLLVSRFTQPLLKLDTTVRLMASGDLQVRTDVHANNEIGVLANNFNIMAENIEFLASKLDRTKSILETALKGTQIIAEAASIPEAIRISLDLIKKETNLEIEAATAVIKVGQEACCKYEFVFDRSLSTNYNIKSCDIIKEDINSYSHRQLGDTKKHKHEFYNTTLIIHLNHHSGYLGFLKITFANLFSDTIQNSKFVETLASSLVAIIATMEAREEKKNSEKQALVEHVTMATNISDKLNSPLLVAWNICNILVKKVNALAESELPPDEKVAQMQQNVQKSVEIAISSFENLRAISLEFASLRDHNTKTPSSSVFKVIHKKKVFE